MPTYTEATGNRIGVMPWGKYKGAPLDQVDKGYLRWVMAKADYASQDLREAIAQVLGMNVAFARVSGADATSLGGAKTENGKDGATDWKARHTEAVKALAEAKAELALARKDRPSDAESFRRLLKQTYASMSRQYHPDMGGSAEKQQVVNEFYRHLIARLQEDQS